MRTCGKSFQGAARAMRKCGSVIPGSDWVLQCPECQRRDEVVKAVNRLAPMVNGGGLPFESQSDPFEMIDPLAKGVKVHTMVSAAIMVSTPQDPNEADVDRILARWSGFAEHAISEWEHTHMSVTTADVRTVTDYLKFMRAQARASNAEERVEMSGSFMFGQIMKSLQQQGASYATAKTAAEDAVTHTKHYHGKDLFGTAWRKAAEVAERLEPGLKITTPK